eukprot:570502-Prymnesium_polylepis.1
MWWSQWPRARATERPSKGAGRPSIDRRRRRRAAGRRGGQCFNLLRVEHLSLDWSARVGAD